MVLQNSRGFAQHADESPCWPAVRHHLAEGGQVVTDHVRLPSAQLSQVVVLLDLTQNIGRLAHDPGMVRGLREIRVNRTDESDEVGDWTEIFHHWNGVQGHLVVNIIYSLDHK